MKNKTYRNILGFFLASMVLLASCKKEDPIKLDAQMATWEISDITSTTADISGFVVAEGAGFTEHGICWNTSGEPTISDQTALADSVDAAVFVAHATGLEFLTKYYVAAYVKTADGTVTYGGDTTFTTLANIATVSVDAITNITATTATSGGNVTDDGKADVTAKGIVWGMEASPAIDSTNVTVTEDGEGEGTFTSSLTELIGGIKYYVRAYATNEIGTSYSDELSFTTENGFAVVTSDSVMNITKTSATLYGTALYTGGTDITERGFYYGTSENPTVADNTASAGTGLGDFNADLSSLAAGTKYYARAYAINSEGTAYGDNIEFETIGEFFLVGSVNGWDNHGVYTEFLGGGVFVAYQYLAAGDEFKFFPVRDTWDNGWGSQGGNCATPGTCVLGGGNICVNNEAGFTADGFYEIKFDAINQTVELSPIASIGVIGDAQAGGWDTDVNLTYNGTSKKWEGQVTFLATGVYKFRADDDWAMNWGAQLTNLLSGGDNIATPGAGTYDIVLDLGGADNFNATVTPAK